MKLSSPFFISSRLLPAVKVGESTTISLEYRETTQGRDVYVYYIDSDKFSYEGDELKTGCQGGGYQEAMISLLSFLSASAESYSYQTQTWSENVGLFPPNVMEWVYQMRNEIQMLSIELEEASELIEY